MGFSSLIHVLNETFREAGDVEHCCGCGLCSVY